MVSWSLETQATGTASNRKKYSWTKALNQELKEGISSLDAMLESQIPLSLAFPLPRVHTFLGDMIYISPNSKITSRVIEHGETLITLWFLKRIILMDDKTSYIQDFINSQANLKFLV